MKFIKFNDEIYEVLNSVLYDNYNYYLVEDNDGNGLILKDMINYIENVSDIDEYKLIFNIFINNNIFLTDLEKDNLYL